MYIYIALKYLSWWLSFLTFPQILHLRSLPHSPHLRPSPSTHTHTHTHTHMHIHTMHRHAHVHTWTHRYTCGHTYVLQPLSGGEIKPVHWSHHFLLSPPSFLQSLCRPRLLLGVWWHQPEPWRQKHCTYEKDLLSNGTKENRKYQNPLHREKINIIS